MGTIYKPTRNDTSKLWKNGKNKDSNYGRSRLKIVYSISGSTASIDYYLQMARSNGDYNTHGTVTAYINGKSTGDKKVTISDGCAKRSDKDANDTVPDSYFTTVGSLKNQSISCDKAGNFSKSFTVKASCGVNNMVLAERTGSFSFGGGTIYSESPTMKITEDEADYTHVYGTCDITNWGEYGTTKFTSKDYDKYAYLYYKDEYTERSTKFSDTTQVSFDVGASSEARDYEIKFRIKNSTFTLEKWAYANPIPVKKPSTCNSITLTCGDSEHTVISTYALEWTKPSDVGSYIKDLNSGITKDGKKFYYLDLWCTDANNDTKYINLANGSRHNSRQAYTLNDNDFSTTKLAVPHNSFIVGDKNIKFRIYTIINYDGKWFYNDAKTGSVNWIIQDDQAKVYIPEINKVGKVWVLDESTNTWKKAKKIFVNTSTNSSNSIWTKHKNPTT